MAAEAGRRWRRSEAERFTGRRWVFVKIEAGAGGAGRLGWQQADELTVGQRVLYTVLCISCREDEGAGDNAVSELAGDVWWCATLLS
jgi:hypothetical protein